MNMVREEQTGWRDLALSARHRQWGFDCPAVDIDFLLIEYDRGKAAALVEYKRDGGPKVSNQHPTIRALVDVGDRAKLPVFGVRYTGDFTRWTVTPLNGHASTLVPGRQVVLTEEGWVSLLYQIRGRSVPGEVSRQWASQGRST